MHVETVKEIQEITGRLAKLLVNVEPATPAEWEAMEKMQAAHKQMRSIEIEELLERSARAGLTK